MIPEEILAFIEDKEINYDKNWYLHATRLDINTINNILQEGIKSACLLNKKGNHFNGSYYISLYKDSNEANRLNNMLKEYPKFIIKDITPLYADSDKYNFRKYFINTKIPLRTSEWDGEYQQYLEIDSSKIIALEYSLSHILHKPGVDIKEKIFFLKELVLCIESINNNLPIFDLESKREINKEKVLSLNL